MVEYERVVFRLVQMPCCGQLLCWINPRRPNFCPECGKPFMQWGASVRMRDDDAILELHPEKVP